MDVEAAQQETQDAEQALVLDDCIVDALLGEYPQRILVISVKIRFRVKKSHSCTCPILLKSHPLPSTSQSEASERAALVEKLQQENNFLAAKLEVAVCVVDMCTHVRSL